MNEIWAIVVLECLNLDPSKCTVKQEHPMFGMNTQAECRKMLDGVYYAVENWTPGTHYRPECRLVRNRWVGSK